jgi:uncharacterized membrane protein
MVASEGASVAACNVCGGCPGDGELVPGMLVREGVAALIKQDHPEWTEACGICRSCLDLYRAKYVQNLLTAEKGELGALEQGVLQSLEQQATLATDTSAEFDQKLTFGQRLADHIASFGGSWGFISLFGAVLFVWIGVNSVALLAKPFDPFPFILLNLVLSCLAAIQAPVIMMSQNRQESKDRFRAEHDYQVNLKAELEIRHLHEKLDHIMRAQWQRLAEIQEVQMDVMEELARHTAANHSANQTPEASQA